VSLCEDYTYFLCEDYVLLCQDYVLLLCCIIFYCMSYFGGSPSREAAETRVI
jgi:hypothetical protein